MIRILIFNIYCDLSKYNINNKYNWKDLVEIKVVEIICNILNN